ncbi:hypothetical protein INH39_00930 [Massilia violaceinigra]|uniref:Lipoprotein n=1 Tax=Massilia violaceinigra TaxID=2045208 RepID=A0ABY4ACP1_9BURK|nr:hypothetical protein [Massilia violaceinigra]UOD30353.1 hypothetical protein INH39_00930 [Massilia violaceinigra]
MTPTSVLMKWRAILAVLALSGAAGCGEAPLYHPAPMAANASALVDASGTIVKWICAKGERHRLVGDANGNAQIPAGARVTVGAYYNQDRLRCLAAASFIPQAGQRYRIDLQIAAERCKPAIYIDDPGTVIGVRLAPGVQPARSCDL